MPATSPRPGAYSANTPLLILPNCAKALVVPDGFETKLNPSSLCADQVMVALVMTSSPVLPGVLTVPRELTGPVHWMSKLHVAGTDAGVRKRNRAFGMLK